MTELDDKILKLKAEGYTNRQISEMLGVNFDFVKRRGTTKFLKTQERLTLKEQAKREFEKLVIDYLPYSNSINNLCAFLGVRAVEYYYKRINDIIKRNNLSTEHFGTLKKANPRSIYSDKDFFIENSSRANANSLKRLIEGGYREYKCECCGISEWNDKPIKLQIHHINGDNKDNRITNLQILCPNCHSQTDNYCSKNNCKHTYKETKRIKELLNNKNKSFKHPSIEEIKNVWNNEKEEKYYCKQCGKEIPKGHLYCSHECHQKSRRLINASNEQLIQDFKEFRSFRKVGEKYGVSDNAIKKKCKREHILEEVYRYITSRARKK